MVLLWAPHAHTKFKGQAKIRGAEVSRCAGIADRIQKVNSEQGLGAFEAISQFAFEISHHRMDCNGLTAAITGSYKVMHTRQFQNCI